MDHDAQPTSFSHSGEWIMHEEKVISQRQIQNEFLLLSKFSSEQKAEDQLQHDSNRDNFSHNMPFRHNHVELEGGHQINASTIVSPLDGKTVDFITTQVPKKHHLSAYWKMIWTFQVSLVVMLCSEESGNDGYIGAGIPDKQLAYSELFGDSLEFKVEIAHVKEFTDSFTSRVVKVTHKESGVTRELKYDIVSGWERSKAPSRKYQWFDTLNKIEESINEARHHHPNSPVVVQSAQGGGRTSIVQAAYYIYQTIHLQSAADVELKDIEISIFGIVKSLKEQRKYSISNLEHYKLLYKIANARLVGHMDIEMVEKPGGYNNVSEKDSDHDSMVVDNDMLMADD